VSEPVVPSWDLSPQKERARKRDGFLKLVIAVLIGLVSVSGAVLTWQSNQLSENATDSDRQAIAETVLQAQNDADVEIRLRSEQQAFAQYKEDLRSADLLAQQSGALRTAGLVSEADAARDQSDELKELAGQLAGLSLHARFVNVDGKGLPDSLDIEGLRETLRANNNQAAKVNPEGTAAHAIDLRNQSQRLDGWTIPLVASVLILTIAQITKQARLRPALTALAVAVYLVSTVVALVGE
jgi:hypothetical protein